jgi:pyruvoyl-dependent arginine decarboxylase (PvlArgDC)
LLFIFAGAHVSECQREKRTTESAQVAKNVELAHSQAKKITELEAACADLKREKEHNCWLSEKHKVFTEKAEREKTELVETHAAEVAKLRGYLDLETRSYTEYR